MSESRGRSRRADAQLELLIPNKAAHPCARCPSFYAGANETEQVALPSGPVLTAVRGCLVAPEPHPGAVERILVGGGPQRLRLDLRSDLPSSHKAKQTGYLTRYALIVWGM